MTPSTNSASTDTYMVVVGSVNQDTFTYVAELPLPGQTILATSTATGLGGKGANQAVAAARLGADVEFIGRLGDDLAGENARAIMQLDGVGVGQLRTVEEMPTGTAHIAVEELGENAIIVYSGANRLLDGDSVILALDDLARIRGRMPSLILAQGELQGEVVDRLADIARDRHIRFVLNLAPVISVAPRTLSQSNPLVVNEVEALELLGAVSPDLPAGEMAEVLAERYGTAVVITLGASGAVISQGDDSWSQPSPRPEQVVDTTGAGDAFAGALAFALWRGSSLRDAVLLGAAAGAHAVTAAGTTTSYPNLEALSDPDVTTDHGDRADSMETSW